MRDKTITDDTGPMRFAMTIQELLERVGNADGPDRELDAALFVALVVNPRQVPAYSASVDAALALVEEKLPGWKWAIAKESDGFGGMEYEAELFGPQYSSREQNPATFAVHLGLTAPLAPIAALLKALIAQAPTARPAARGTKTMRKVKIYDPPPTTGGVPITTTNVDLSLHDRLKNHEFVLEYVAALEEDNRRIDADRDRLRALLKEAAEIFEARPDIQALLGPQERALLAKIKAETGETT